MSKRGPKPKPLAPCGACGTISSPKRGYCSTCYVRLLRQGKLKKLEIPSVPASFSPVQEEMILGALLGDGCIYRRKETHRPYFSVQRTLGDKEYSRWQVNILADFVVRFYDGDSFDVRTDKTYLWTKFITHRCEAFVPLYQAWYPHGKKLVPEQLTLTPLSLAVWFADDGNVRAGCSPWRLLLKLSTHGFCEEDVERLASMLRERYGEYFGVTREGDKRMIYAADAATRAFVGEIDSVYPPGIDRKAYWRLPEARYYENLPPRAKSAVYLRGPRTCKE